MESTTLEERIKTLINEAEKRGLSTLEMIAHESAVAVAAKKITPIVETFQEHHKMAL